MTGHRSTTLGLVRDTCPKALDFYDAQEPYDRRVFSVGIAAHAVAEALVKSKDTDPERVAAAVSLRLVTEGRSFDGVPEPPLPPEAVAEGREIALRFWRWAQDTSFLSPEWKAELPLAMTATGEATPYRRDAFYRGVLDVVGVLEVAGIDEWDTGTGLVHIDYKTRWGTNESELETIQMRGQTLLALANAEALGLPNPAFVRRQVVNLRTMRTYHADLWFNDPTSEDTLAAWRKDLDLAIAHAATRTPSPGVNCFGCPYVGRCPAAATVWSDTDPVSVATAWVAAKARAADLQARVRAACADRSALTVPGGRVGYIAKEQRTVRDDAARTAAIAWFRPEDPATWAAANETTLGLLGALGLGSGNMDAVATRLHPGKGAQKSPTWREDREAFLSSVVTTRTATEFGFVADAPAENKDDPTE